MLFIELSQVPEREIIVGFTARFVHTTFMTFSYWTVKEGAALPAHRHPHEQVTHVLRGRFEMTIDGETRIVEEGWAAVIPPDTVHCGRALTDCYIMDVFHPIREDYR